MHTFLSLGLISCHRQIHQYLHNSKYKSCSGLWTECALFPSVRKSNYSYVSHVMHQNIFPVMGGAYPRVLVVIMALIIGPSSQGKQSILAEGENKKGKGG